VNGNGIIPVVEGMQQQQQSEGLSAMLSMVAEVLDVCSLGKANGKAVSAVEAAATVAAHEQLTLEIVDAVNEVVDATVM